MQETPPFRSYVAAERLGESLQAIVYRGHLRSQPGTPLVLKLLKLLSNRSHESRHLRHKIERLKVLHDPRACTPESLAVENDHLVIVQPWFAGQSLDVWAAQRTVTLTQFFTIACALADTLQAVHEAGITHGGVKPHNILVQPETLTLRLTDFITPMDIRDVSHFIYDREFVRGTLAYTSPEQTGRINYRVDFSTDLYSLGIVLYELLTGKLPFFSTDPLELIHSHLAEETPQLHRVATHVPHQISDIISKLTVKQPEKRYQSAAGVLADLIRCRDDYLATQQITPFPLGMRDHTKRVIFISRMVGRVQESQLIQQAYDEVVQGQFRSVFISGWSGIGKTRLIQELQKPLVRGRGYFTSGKFDQYQKNIPYSSLIQALRNLVRTLLTESDARVTKWKELILNAVQQQGRVITDVVPELEFIIGAQPDVAKLPPVEARNRFNNLFGRFLGCLASSDNPLVLFIDDLQWCDSATFDFLQNLFANHHEHPYLLFLGAYRHNEVDAQHPLTRLMRNVQESSGPIQGVRIGPLDVADCHEMVAYILDSSLESTRHLAQFIAHLTEGNPLFVSESLAWLYNEDLLQTNDEHQWQWNMGRIRESRMPATVVDLFSAKVRKLPADTLHILERCACMGNRFTADDVSLVLGIGLEQLYEQLKPVLHLGLLLENKTDLQFVHDRVQEAVLAQIDQEERNRIHWRVGNRLLQALGENADLEQQDNLFTIAAHLNRGRPAVLDEVSLYRLVEINFRAGNKALNALATDAANEFFQIAHDYLPHDSWSVAYEKSYRIYQRLAKTSLMCGNYAASEALINQLIEHAVSDLDKAEALAEQTTSLSSFGNFIQAIATANRGLAYFDKSIPPDAALAQERMQDLMERVASQGDVWNSIAHMPFTQERRSKIELAFYSELIPDLYMSGLVPQLYLAAAQSTLNCLEGGMDESVIYSFSIMGLNLGEQGRFELAFRYEDLAHELCARHPDTFGATRGMNGIVWCNMHSRSHPEHVVQYSRKGIQCGKNCGDLYNAGLSYGPLMWCLATQGKDLHLVEEAANECLQFSDKNQLSFSTSLAQAVHAGWVTPMKANTDAVDMATLLAQWERDNYVAAAGSYFALLGMSQHLLGQHEAAQDSFKSVQQHLHGLTDNVLKRLWFVFRVLNRLVLRGRQSWSELQTELEPLVQQVQTWAQFGPLLKPYLALIRAEVARADGQAREARNLYLDATDTARAEGYTLLAGYALERLGGLLVESGRGAPMLYLGEARRLYLQCHAEGLLAQLDARHPAPSPASPSVPSDSAGHVMEPTTLPNLDVQYLMKSASALSAEIDLAQLLQMIMRIVLESSGAQHGYLLTRQDDELVIVAENHVGHERPSTERRVYIPGVHDLCQGIVNYVFHTRQKVVLRDASSEGDFQNAPEVQALGLRSVLCLPVIKQTKMVGVLYLESRLSDGIFTPRNISLTEVLTSHAAISLENASLLDETRIAAKVFESYAGMMLTDESTTIIRVNPAFTKLTGYSAEEAIGNTPRMLKSGRQNKEFYRQLWDSVLEHQFWQGELWNRKKNGDEYLEWLTVTAVTNPAGRVTNYIGTFTDITRFRQAQQEIHSLAFYDPLTRLPNRRLLYDRLQQALLSSVRHNCQGAILFLDMDNFKALNDTKGHAVGDKLLIEVTHRLVACVRSDDTVARLGGDEFVVMLEEICEDQGQAVARATAVGEKILESLRQPFHLDGYEHYSTCSIGISLFHGDTIGADEWLKNADTAMYEAKQHGRDAVRFFDPAMQQVLESRLHLESSLRHALMREQFRLHYQAQVNAHGRMVGAEVLLRWDDPISGAVSPSVFIPVAETMGLIVPIGQWVLQQACSQLKRWEQSPLTADLQLSVNVSARQLRLDEFVDQVLRALDESGANPQRLTLELTESLMVDNVDDMVLRMRKLKSIGVSFSLDDFGTGHSSLAQLKRLPLDQLKIDQSFVRDIANDPNDAAIVQTIIAIADTLGLDAMAEGVETETQLRFLKLNGCLSYQGYLFGHPLPLDEFERLLASRAAADSAS